MCIVIITFDNQGNNVYCIIIKTNEEKSFVFSPFKMWWS